MVAVVVLVVILTEAVVVVPVVILVEVVAVMITEVVVVEEASGCWFAVLNKTLVRVTIILAVSVPSAPSVTQRDVSSQRKMHPLSPLRRHLILQPVANLVQFRQLLVPQRSLVRPNLPLKSIA
jgi:hypothetical protein